jgi:hypothetical protein
LLRPKGADLAAPEHDPLSRRAKDHPTQILAIALRRSFEQHEHGDGRGSFRRRRSTMRARRARSRAAGYASAAMLRCALALVFGCGSTPPPAEEPSAEPPVDAPEGVRFQVADAASEGAYMAKVARAEEIVRAFAAEHGWEEHAARRHFDSVEIVADREALWARVLELYEAPDDTPLPDQPPVAALEARVLLAVTEEEYARAHPEYAAEDESFAKLLAHEILHRLHIAVVGDEETMGPRWFYEGFAVVASGQRFDAGLTYATAADALAGTRETDALAYRRYAAALRFFLRCASIEELVDRAWREDFERDLEATCPSAIDGSERENRE